MSDASTIIATTAKTTSIDTVASGLECSAKSLHDSERPRIQHRIIRLYRNIPAAESRHVESSHTDRESTAWRRKGLLLRHNS